MSIDVTDIMACPDCKSRLKHITGSSELQCTDCNGIVHFRDGIYLTESHAGTSDAKVTIEEFGKRWNKVFNKMGGLTNFLMPMLKPVEKEFFRGKVIVDAGGGFGRLTKLLLDYGAEHVVLLDASDAVLAARIYLKDYGDRVTIIKGNLLDPPLLQGVLDLFFCHGVLHHTGDPSGVISNLSKTLKKDTGAMILWVYAKEGNTLMSGLINIVRLVSLRIGDRGRWALSSLIDLALWGLTSVIYRPMIKLGAKKEGLWYGEYLLDFLFDPEINNRVDRLQMYHDFITTGIIEYYSRQELQKWVDEAGYRKAHFYFYRKQSWSVAASFDHDESFSGSGEERSD